MDYNEWGSQYLDEAQKIKDHLTPLRRQAKSARNREAEKLYQRIAAMNEMYLDCLHTGKFLMESGGFR